MSVGRAIADSDPNGVEHRGTDHDDREAGGCQRRQARANPEDPWEDEAQGREQPLNHPQRDDLLFVRSEAILRPRLYY